MKEMSAAEYARHRNVSEAAVSKWISAGKIPVRAEGRRRWIDAAAADVALGDNTQRVIAEEPEDDEAGDDEVVERGPASGSLIAARTANETFRARKAQLELARDLGKVRPVDDVLLATQMCAEVALRSLRIARRADDIVSAARGGVIAVRELLRAIEREQRTVFGEAFAKLAAGEIADGGDVEEAE